ncbi:winged helix-turn-helix transcriptional regulator [archaeon]|nr:winged helix-turn-helix transcriptional regulator [archaeon]
MFVAVFKRKNISVFDEKVTENVTEKVTENQIKILESVATNPHITVVELAGIVDISERKIKENIRKLKEKGLIKRIGPDKGGHWEVVIEH